VSANRPLRRFGADVVKRLLPHRAPLLMVDRVEDYALDPRARLRACRHISANEDVFRGHFPDWSVWPGVYTIEGMGQSCLLLVVLLAIRDMGKDAGEDPDRLLDALGQLDGAFRLRPALVDQEAIAMLDAFQKSRAPMGFGSTVDVKLSHPVFAGQRLDYEVELTRHHENVARFEVSASVEGQIVARGTMGATAGLSPGFLRTLV